MSSERHTQIKDIFLKARDLPATERPVFVKNQAKGDAEIESEVLALLENDTEETILSVDKVLPIKAVIDPLGLNKLNVDSGPSAFGQFFLNSKGRVGIALLLVALILGFLGYISAEKTKSTLADIRGEEAMAILNSNVETLQNWIENYQSITELVVQNDEINAAIQKINTQENVGKESLELDSLLMPYLKHTYAFSYLVTDLNGKILYSNDKQIVGDRINDRFGKEVFVVAGGKAQFVLPFYPSKSTKKNNYYTDKPLVWMQVPVFDAKGEIVATFGIGRKADVEFTRILRTARIGNSGETYAINKDAWFLSESRYEDEMRSRGLMHADTNVSSILNLQARKKTYDLSKDLLPLTDLANLVIASSEVSSSPKRGVLTVPSEDYKGAQVIGAWAWLPNYEFGLITQVDAKEAYAPVKYLYFLIAAILLFLLAAAAYSFFNAWQVIKMQGAFNSAMQLGQYELKKLIEEGGMGAVYLAQHKLLKRPTAIKVIRVDKQDEEMAKRFEREVNLASQLNHPNTIEIYDYGFTSDGQAYFAMEYLNGVNLARIVNASGAMPAGRVIHILRQVCASLHEAHTLGMVHRDIKPQNIMLVNRIGLHDFVKVLDFGLAKPFEATEGMEETRAITGTPVYIAPERLKRPGLAEPSADIYAVGALAYFLLAGYPIFSFSSDLDILYQVLNEMPKPLPENVPQTLARLTFFCLEKEPEDRPSSMEELKLFLDNLSSEYPWTSEDAAKKNN